ncbi:MAG: proline racemase family protein [Alphaproteobacteria bacterium]|nr:proline racemase family protein [Alphaproteobacteria bacterium]
MSTAMTRSIHTVDSHTEGNPTRVIVGGVKVPPGATLLDKRAWLMANDDGLRRLLNFEPRGSGMMCSVLLLPAERKDSDFAAIIMEQDEYVPMCGHCIIGTATTVVATGMVAMKSPVTTVRFDTPAGQVACDVAVKDGAVQSVSFDNVDSFVLHDKATIDVEGIGKTEVTVAYGGDFYAFVDADKIGLDLSPHNDGRLIDTWRRVRGAVGRQLKTVHPERPDIDVCYQVLFTSSKKTSGDYKQTILCPPGAIDRSPCGTGTSARVALLYTRGEMGLNQPRKFEGVLGTYFTGEAVKVEKRGGVTYVRPRVTGRAYVTGYHHFVLDPADPLPEGFRIGNAPRKMGAD